MAIGEHFKEGGNSVLDNFRRGRLSRLFAGLALAASAVGCGAAGQSYGNTDPAKGPAYNPDAGVIAVCYGNATISKDLTNPYDKGVTTDSSPNNPCDGRGSSVKPPEEHCFNRNEGGSYDVLLNPVSPLLQDEIGGEVNIVVIGSSLTCEQRNDIDWDNK